MKKKIFISHSSKDKEFVRKLALELEKFEFYCWLDEWEIKVGDSITSKIGQGLEGADYVILVLSKNSVNSTWVDQEWKAKYFEAVNKNKVMILPALIEDCKIPFLLKDKKYANFKDDFYEGLKDILSTIDPEKYSKKNDLFDDLTKDLVGQYKCKATYHTPFPGINAIANSLPILKNFSNPIYHIKKVNNYTVYFAEGDGYPFKVELQKQSNGDIHFKILEQKLGKTKIVGNGNAKHPLHGILINETKKIIFSYRLTDWTQIPGNYTVEGAKET